MIMSSMTMNLSKSTSQLLGQRSHVIPRPSAGFISASNQSSFTTRTFHSYNAQTKRVSSRKIVSAQVSQTSNAAPTTATSKTWESFCESATGEWDGITATFDSDGEPQQLPEYYVPQAFRDWGVQLFDWTSQCSVLATSEGLKYASRRMLPTVGCEADAIAFTEEPSEVITPSDPALFVSPDGSYNLVQGNFNDPQCFKVAIEHCITLSAASPGDKKTRLRAVHRFQRATADRPWALFFIELHKERFDRPYDGKQELAGCGGGMDKFAEETPCDIANIVDNPSKNWTVVSGSVYSTENGLQEGLDASSGKSLKTDEIAAAKGSTVALPNVWSSVQLDNENITVRVVLGTKLDDGSVKISGRTLVDGKTVASELLILS